MRRSFGLGLLAALLMGATVAQIPASVPSTPVLANATIIGTGELIVVQIPAVEVDLVWNVTGTVSGTLPTLAFTITSVDPLDAGMALSGDLAPVTTASITSDSSGVLTYLPFHSTAVRVSWVVTGTLASFGGVYATLAVKNPLKY